MVSSGMLRRVPLVRTDVSEELSASIIRVTRIGEIGTTLAITSRARRLLVTANVVPSSPILVNLMMEALSSSETSVLSRTTWRDIPEDAILHRLLMFTPRSIHPRTDWMVGWLGRTTTGHAPQKRQTFVPVEPRMACKLKLFYSA
jgi:hypothetical protein